MRNLLSIAGALALLSALAPAQLTLTTTFTSNNNGAAGWITYFDLLANVPVTITQLDVNVFPAGTAGSIDIYMTAQGGTHAGNQLNASAWSLVSAGAQLVSNGPGVPTPAVLTSPLTISPGTYGFAILYHGVSMRYTNGSGTNQTYSTAEMTVNCGSSTSGMFSGSLFDPRVWNGTIHYTLLGNYANVTPYGTGCGGGGPAGFYEEFTTSSPFDLAGTPPGSRGVTLNAASPAYVLTIGSGRWFTPTSTPMNFTSSNQTLQRALPWPFPYQGGITNDLWICSNGWIALESTTLTDGSETLAELLSGPARVCCFWDDLNPATSGAVHFDQDPTNPGIVYVTWVNVPESTSTGANTFQAAFRQGGSVELRYQSLTARDALVGFSPGNGSRDPGPTDISAIQAVQLGDGRDPLALRSQGSSRPILGSTYNMEITDIPSGTTLGALVFSLNQINPGASLASLGMAGCNRYVGLGGSIILGVGGATAPIALPVPNNPVLAGLHIYYQAATFSTGYTSLGVIASNGLDAKLDVQ